MSAATTTPQGQLIERLLKTGRWSNQSEVVRYGIELVAREVELENLSPLPDEVLARCYQQMSRGELAEEEKQAGASTRPKRGELD